MEVKYLNHMGSDLTVVNAARVSFNKVSEKLDERDEKLIKYLATHNHWTPFAHPQISLHVKVPIFIARQLGKHQVGLVMNEVSRRYVDDEPEFFMPEQWRGRAENKKQGSSDVAILQLKHGPTFVEDLWGDVDNNWHPSLHISAFNQGALDTYRWLLESGVAPEQARMVLPQSMYTEWHWTGSLAAWGRVYSLRIDPHAQKEVQEIARQIGEIVEPLFPYSWKALTDG